MLRVGIVGDLMFSHHIRDALEAHEDPLWPFEPCLDLLRSHDVLIGNLETPLGDPLDRVPGARPDYYANLKAIEAIARAGFTIVSLANNHICDFGPKWVERTIAALEEHKISWCGLEGPKIGRRVGVRLDTTPPLCLLAYCGMRNVARNDLTYHTISPLPHIVKADIEEALAQGHVVIVLIHEGGFEVPHPSLEKVARHAQACGATIVVVGHSHVVSGIEKVNHSLIAWGLGNFIAATRRFTPERREGLLLSCTLTENGLVEARWTPTWITDSFQVTTAPPEVSERIQRRVQELSAVIASGGASRRYESAITPQVFLRRLREAFSEMVRGGGRNIWPFLKTLRWHHIHFVWVGLRAIFSSLLGRRR